MDRLGHEIFFLSFLNKPLFILDNFQIHQVFFVAPVKYNKSMNITSKIMNIMRFSKLGIAALKLLLV